MLIDLLNSANYIMVNMDAIRLFGLNAAVYCAELLNIYKKALLKKKLIDGKYFRIDREFITKRTSLSTDDQIKCDLNLKKINILEFNPSDPDCAVFNIEVYASLLSCEDVKILASIKKTQVNKPRGANEVKRERIALALKEAINCRTYDIILALRDWIDSIMSDPHRVLSKPQVILFQDRLDEYCNGNVEQALDIIKIATIHQYVDCQWAINTYEKDRRISAARIPVTEQKKTDVKKLGSEVF